ncbi:hypothetical protein [Hymenobacter rubripertinctus]|uniref:Lipoprotein n=1 Tax=Hymenobacter rubripertinctus TaxID=2029981 RepID=A0A418QPU5_9BACT|nr:hypothetical protein [Hymenobacter rubripertinctus]RIY07267.1 hypothetical protein D0T11_17145 [Hymenobacter rubripertinctus]
MPTFPTLRLAVLLAFTSLGAVSCISPPDYPDTPQIEFRSITQEIKLDALQQEYNNVGVSINYKDGDGNLGMNKEEVDAGKNDPLNPNSYNFICIMQVLNSNNTFTDFTATPALPGYSGQFPYLPPAEQGDRKAPLRGDITLDIPITTPIITPFQTVPKGSVVRFKVKIKDRTLNESNEIVTSPITLQ